MKKTHGSFNTNRQYTRLGQRIGWALVSTNWDDSEFQDPQFDWHSVVFYDADRLIIGKITILGPITDSKILAEYDNGRYEYPTNEYREYLDIANNEARGTY